MSEQAAREVDEKNRHQNSNRDSHSWNACVCIERICCSSKRKRRIRMVKRRVKDRNEAPSTKTRM